MIDVFISHVEEDAGIAEEMAQGLEAAGYTAWYYERDAIPGPSYLIQTGKAVEEAGSIILVISANSLGSHQITKEVVRAHECDKHFIPVLRDVSHVEFQQRQPEWREAVGAATSIRIPPEGVSAILPRVIEGVRTLGTPPTPGTGPATGTAPGGLPILYPEAAHWAILLATFVAVWIKQPSDQARAGLETCLHGMGVSLDFIDEQAGVLRDSSQVPGLPEQLREYCDLGIAVTNATLATGRGDNFTVKEERKRAIQIATRLLPDTVVRSLDESFGQGDRNARVQALGKWTLDTSAYLETNQLAAGPTAEPPAAARGRPSKSRRRGAPAQRAQPQRGQELEGVRALGTEPTPRTGPATGTAPGGLPIFHPKAAQWALMLATFVAFWIHKKPSDQARAGLETCLRGLGVSLHFIDDQAGVLRDSSQVPGLPEQLREYCDLGIAVTNATLATGRGDNLTFKEERKRAIQIATRLLPDTVVASLDESFARGDRNARIEALTAWATETFEYLENNQAQEAEQMVDEEVRRRMGLARSERRPRWQFWRRE